MESSLKMIVVLLADTGERCVTMSLLLRTARNEHHSHFNKGFSVMASRLNKYSSRITEPKSQGASQAMLYATWV